MTCGARREHDRFQTESGDDARARGAFPRPATRATRGVEPSALPPPRDDRDDFRRNRRSLVRRGGFSAIHTTGRHTTQPQNAPPPPAPPSLRQTAARKSRRLPGNPNHKPQNTQTLSHIIRTNVKSPYAFAESAGRSPSPSCANVRMPSDWRTAERGDRRVRGVRRRGARGAAAPRRACAVGGIEKRAARRA